MRFCLPSEVHLQAPSVRDPILVDSNSELRGDDVIGSQSFQTSVDFVTDAFRRLESLHLLGLKQKWSSNLEKAKVLEAKRKKCLEYNEASIDQDFSQFWSKLQSEVLQIIANQEVLQKQEEERIKNIKEEKEKKERKEQELKAKSEAEAKIAAEEQAKLKAKVEAERKKEEDRKAEQEKEIAEQKKLKLREKIIKEQEAAARKAKGFTDFNEIETQLVQYRKKIDFIKAEIVKPMNENKDLKKNVNALKRKINIKLGQLSNSMSQLNQISRDVASLAKLTSANALAYNWILNFISKAIVSQAETEVTVKPTAALPLARLSVYLLHDLDGLYDYLCPRFVKKCCFVIGYTCPIDTEEGRIRMGWRRTDNKWEPEVKYEERVGGICTVWAVMARLDPSTKFAFFSFDAEWKFAARMLNLERSLLSNVHYVIVSNWWEAAALMVVQQWGRQGLKLLLLLSRGWAKWGQDLTFPAATRLEILGDDYESKNNLNQLKEMEA